ncbi:hypothetical protein APLC1_4219 [Limnospira platensis C1]|nr:hypothetical protein APLC1_4219 [Arthrospira platensis C1]
MTIAQNLLEWKTIILHRPRTQKLMLPRQELLNGIENRDCIARIIDLAEQALKTWEITQTEFLSPPEIAEAQGIFRRLTEIQALSWGVIRKQNVSEWRSHDQKSPSTQAM